MAYREPTPDDLIDSVYPTSDAYDETLATDANGTEIRDRTILNPRINATYTGLPFDLTDENTHVRLFEGEFSVLSRAIVDLGDGDPACLPFEQELLLHMARSGFPRIRPKQPDESDWCFLFAKTGQLPPL